MKVYLFRHGQKDITPFSDPDLTSFGHQQARKLAQEIHHGALLRGTHFLASPRLRAQNTLRPAAELCGHEIQVHSDLDQRGSQEGFEEFRVRVQNFLSSLARKFQPQDVVYLCTHHDWIEEAMSCIPCDVDLLDMRYSVWSPAQFMHFQIQEGIWHLQCHDRIAL